MTKKHEDSQEEVKNVPEKTRKLNLTSKKILLPLVLGLLVLLLLIPSAFLVYAYGSSPTVIRNPKFNHYHFRMQIVTDGQVEDFSAQDYQQEYSKDLCSADITESPIHFHDNKSQFVHIHWDGMTGGLVMKEYGWNFVGGSDSTLGYRMDSLPVPKRVPTKGQLLPQLPEDPRFYVYIGDENSYTEKNFEEWKNQDLEDFFGVKSNVPEEASFIENLLFPSAFAHGDNADGHHGTETEEQKLTRINNLLGNVVIFVQQDRPTDEEIKERFNNLVPLSESVCGG